MNNRDYILSGEFHGKLLTIRIPSDDATITGMLILDEEQFFLLHNNDEYNGSGEWLCELYTYNYSWCLESIDNDWELLEII